MTLVRTLSNKFRSYLFHILMVTPVIFFIPESIADVNFATSGTPTQSSTYGGYAYATRANDNNTNGNWANNSVSSTNGDAYSWWEIDLGKVIDITTIKLWNRINCCLDRLSNFYVFVSDTPFTSTNIVTTYYQSGVQATYHAGIAGTETDFTINRTGRYVRVQLYKTGILSLAEVQIFGNELVSNTIATTPLTVSAAVAPNMMLLIDTSGSMDNIIWHSGFDPTTTYDSWGFDSSDGNIQLYNISLCSSSAGWYYASRNGNYKCLKLPDPVGSDSTRYTGNYLNYIFSNYGSNSSWTNLTSVLPDETRMEVARDVATTVVDDTTGVRFGVSRFYGPSSYSYGHGATISEGCDDNNTSAIKSAISGYTAYDNTPLAEALYEITRYFRGMSSYYHSSTSYTSPIQYRCQKNYSIVITDGLPSYDTSIPTNDPADTADTSRSLPNWDGVASSTAWGDYPNFPQYSDGHGTSSESREAYSLYLDDIAKFAYDIDFITTGTDLDGESFEDPDFDQQNMQTYTVGFSIAMQMLEDAAEYGNGNYYEATNSSQLVTALTDAIDDAKGQAIGSAAPASVNSGRLETGSTIYQAHYDSTDWSGDIYAYALDTTDGSVSTTATWQASNNIPTEDSREIFTYDSTAASGTGAGIEFEWANLNTDMVTILTNGVSSTYGLQLTNWLRGDTTSTSGQPNENFRSRSSLLGDIVNSAPLFVGQNDFNHDLLPNTEGASYNTFISNSSYTNRTDAIYAGANDGMLHAFDADNGSELFAFIPSFLFSNLPDLSDSSYGDNHKYFVDGPQYVAPAYIGSNWKTVLMGSTGAGARGVYALDVTTPSTFSESNVMWEFTNDDDSDMGYSIAQPTIVRLPDGNWYAAVGNGYHSDDYEAVLFLINLQTGAAIKLETGNGDSTNPNGLSSPVPVDLDGDHIVDVIYAGDFRGNMWRFGTTTALSSGWTSNILFTGTAPTTSSEQYITTRPAVGAHPDGGVMVYFGTGKYFETGDNTVPASPEVESFYGIRDTGVLTSANLGSDRTDLQPQTIFKEAYGVTVGSATQDVRVISNNDVDYTSERGWYLDLQRPDGTKEGERVVQAPRVHKGRIIFVTMIPTAGSCTGGGNSWLMEMDAVSGKRISTSVIDVNGDGVIDSNDMVTIDGVQYPVTGLRYNEILSTPAIVQTEGKEYKYMLGSTGNINKIAETGGFTSGRQSWRRIR